MHALPLVDELRPVIGIVAESDLPVKEELGQGRVRTPLQRRDRVPLAAPTAGEIMTSPVVTFDSSQTLGQAACATSSTSASMAVGARVRRVPGVVQPERQGDRGHRRRVPQDGWPVACPTARTRGTGRTSSGRPKVVRTDFRVARRVEPSSPAAPDVPSREAA